MLASRTKKSMNIALITLEGGGISTVCYGLAANLAKKSVSSMIFADTSKKHELAGANSSLRVNRLYRFNMPPRSFWFQLQNSRFLIRQLKEFDIIHGVAPDASTIISRYKTQLRKPWVVSFHSDPFSYAKEFLNMPINKWTLPGFAHQIMEFPYLYTSLKICVNHADHIFVCSYSALNEFKAVYGSKLNQASVIYNGLNFQDFDNIKPPKVKPVGERSIVYYGRLIWVKGLAYLLRAFKILKTDCNVRLHIFGAGPEGKKLEKLAFDEGLENKVCFHGRVPKVELISWIKSADLVVAPSLHEAQSMTVLEAMACKKPVIAFNIPSMKEIISDNKTGLLAKPFDCKDLSDKIALALNDREYCMTLGMNAYTYVREKHDWNQQIVKYLDVYNRLLDS